MNTRTPLHTPGNNSKLADRLRRISESLNAGIAQATENPLLFAESPALRSIEELCASVVAVVPDGVPPRDLAIENLCWEVRTRAGRLQRLLDSASRFYSTCFSAPQARPMVGGSSESLVYGVHGELDEISTSGYLAFDC